MDCKQNCLGYSQSAERRCKRCVSGDVYTNPYSGLCWQHEKVYRQLFSGFEERLKQWVENWTTRKSASKYFEFRDENTVNIQLRWSTVMSSAPSFRSTIDEDDLWNPNVDKSSFRYDVQLTQISVNKKRRGYATLALHLVMFYARIARRGVQVEQTITKDSQAWMAGIPGFEQDTHGLNWYTLSA